MLIAFNRSGTRAYFAQARDTKREYWVQVEGVATPEKLQRLSTGVVIQGRAALPCVARALEHPPDFPPRNPPIRFRPR